MAHIYMDGSYSTGERAVGYGVRIEIGDGIEHYGGYFVNPRTDGSLHEHFAFIEAALLAKRHGLKPSECHFVTDYDQIVYGAQGFTAHREGLLRALVRVRKYFRPEEFNAAIVYLTARFTWQKGHSHCVNNRRVDFLASLGRKKITGQKMTKAYIEYDKWLKLSYNKGFGAKIVKHYTPFTNSIAERNEPVYALCA